MADDETLKLPKPLSGTDIRTDFLTFPPDRRWDLLGFIKSEEVEEIKSCEVGPDGHRYYLVRWKESWKPESSLVYCEKLLQDFWSQRSLLQQNTNPSFPNDVAISDKTVEENSASLEDKLLLPANGNQVELNHLSNAVEDNVTASVDIISESTQNVTEDPSDTYSQHVSSNEDSMLKKVDFIEVVDSDQPACVPSPILPQQTDKVFIDSQNNEDNGSLLSEKNVNEEESQTDNLPDACNVAEKSEDEDTSKVDDVTCSNDLESPSKKGAPKRKARHPRQSVNSLGTNRKEKMKKVKEKLKRIREKAKAPKVSKNITVSSNGSNVENGEMTHDSFTNNCKCMVCDKHLSSEQNLMKHLLTHNNNHTCPVCQKTFKSTHFLKHHMDIHNSSYQYTCPVCGKKFKFKNNMRGHIRKHNMEKKFQCSLCQKKFIGRYNLKEHMKSHSDLRPYACDFCSKAYKDRGALNKHLLTHQEKKVECEICKRPFTNAKQVERHMQFHYSWPGDSFKRKANIGSDGEKTKHKCEHCDKTFNHYSSMNTHVHKKHKEKKIQCSNCPKTFAYQYELREHMFIHLGGQGSKFKCQFCEKSFQRSTTLKNHERTTHLGIKRFKCDICGKMFGTKFNMKVHIEKLHNTNSNEEVKPRSLITKNDPTPDNEMTAPTFSTGEIHSGMPSIAVSLSAVQQHHLLRNIHTSDIIRNAMSHIPELNCFPPLTAQPNRYQFYGITQPDFSVSQTPLS